MSGIASGSAPLSAVTCFALTRACALIAPTTFVTLKNQGRSACVSFVSTNPVVQGPPPSL
jgi:hypothetical protein